MSLCKDFGKDKVIFATKEDHSTPSTIQVQIAYYDYGLTVCVTSVFISSQLTPAEPAPGLILKSGEINWNCPCLGGMATGPCGVEFRGAFSCFHDR